MYVARTVPEDSEDHRLLTSHHTIQAMLAFIRRHADSAIGVDCTKADSEQRFALEDFYHVEAITPRLFRAPISATTKKAIDSAMNDAEEIKLDSLAQLRPIDVRRYLGVVFRENIGRTIGARLQDANHPGVDNLYVDRQTLSNLTTLSDIVARRREGNSLHWTAMAIVGTKMGPLAFVPPGDSGRFATAGEADAFLHGLKTEATLLDVTENESIVAPPAPLTTMQTLLRAEAESGERMKTYVEALNVLERNELLVDALSLASRWHMSTFRNTLPAQLEAIARNIPNLKALCDEIRAATAEMRKDGEVPECFSARDNERSAPRIHPGSDLSALSSPGEDTTMELARRIWTMHALNLLEALLPAKRILWTVATVTIGGKPFVYKRSDIIDFGWERAAMHLSDPTDLKPKRAEFALEPVMRHVELTVVPVPVQMPAVRDVDLLRVLLEGDADHEHAFAPVQRLMKDISTLHAQKMIAAGDDGLGLTKLGSAIVALTPLPLFTHAFGNTIVRESQALDGNVEALASFLHRAYAVYRSFYDYVRQAPLDKLPKWKPKKKGAAEGIVQVDADGD